MKPLRVLVLVHNSPAAQLREGRPVGYWSYPVPQFTWDIQLTGKGAFFDTHVKGYDLIWEDDGAAWPEYRKGGAPVVAYYVDSTLSHDNHYLPRLKQSRQADLILIDHDDLKRFKGSAPVRRMLHCVNDRIFRDYGEPKTIDVAFHCGTGGSERRKETRRVLHDICHKHGWTYASGVRGLEDYARAMNRAKIVVNVPRYMHNRPHRVFDALACWTCLLDLGSYRHDQLGELQAGHDYAAGDFEILKDSLDDLLNHGFWPLYSEAGYKSIDEHHTWSVRAAELRTLLNRELGL